MKKEYQIKMGVFGGAFFVLFISFIIYFFSGWGYVWTNDAFIEGFGSDLSTNVTERVVRLYCDEGDFVERGQLIAQLENNVPLAQKAAAQARLKSAQEEILVQEASYKKIRNDFVRATEGIEDKVISAQDFDHSEKDLEIAFAQLQLAYANRQLAEKELEVIEAELSHYTIEAPQDGMIAKRWVWVGDVTTPGESLFTMYDLENVWVTANVEEKKLERVRMGAVVDIHIDAYPSYTFKGEVFTIKGAAASQFSLVPQNNATGNFTKVEQRIPVKISISRPDNFPEDQPLYLFPGMSAEVYIRS